MRISDWSSDVCSSDLGAALCGGGAGQHGRRRRQARALLRGDRQAGRRADALQDQYQRAAARLIAVRRVPGLIALLALVLAVPTFGQRSEEHTSELQSLMRISYAVFCLKKKTQQTQLDSELSR